MSKSYPPLLDVLIIGAGPCGLAVASRLKEETPSAMFTDEEHQRYHWINKHRGRMNLVRAQQGRKLNGAKVRSWQPQQHSPPPPPSRRTSSSSSPSSSSSSVSETDTDTETEPGPPPSGDRLSMLVLDSSGREWMERWNRAFRTLEIAQLRSPMFFHVDPGDRDGMLAYTQEMGREADLWKISGCVGKEVSKHKRKMKMKLGKAQTSGNIDERDRKDYFSPSTTLFADYCSNIASRYGLDAPGLIQQREVVDIRYGFHADLSPARKIFTVTTSDGGRFYSSTVVLAVGPGGSKIYPFPLVGDETRGACHSTEIRSFPSANVQRKIQRRQETNLVIVGGGLSSAQIVDMAIRRGVSKVWLLLRSDFKVKHFDIPLSWMGKFKNFEKAAFWSADTDEERVEMIKAARNGGSITPRYQKILKHHVAHRQLSIHPRTVIREKQWCSDTQTWSLVTDPPIPDLPDIDYVYLATGTHMDVHKLPLLRRMHRDYPIEARGGLPCLTDDLMWHVDVPLFLTGRLGALRLGPGAPNLEGARLGAERIAWAMEEVLGSGMAEGGVGIELDRSKECFCGLGNRFAGLTLDVE